MISGLKKFKISIIVLSICAGFFACKKSEQVIVPGNTAPPDHTISNSVKENYVNKVYISVLGREPDSLERLNGKVILDKNNLSLDNRKQFLDTVLNNPEYYDRIYSIARIDLLNDLDTAEITQEKAIFTFLLTNTTYQYAWPQLIVEIKRMDTLQKAAIDLRSGVMNPIELHRCCVNNYFYDQLNMGTENFVVSMFQHFLFRYPTTSELSQCKAMVDGLSSTAFLKTGRTKYEFLEIFFGSNDYFEGQVRDLYVRYLFRQPTSEESSLHATNYKTTLNYKNLQKDILSLDEYVGL